MGDYLPYIGASDFEALRGPQRPENEKTPEEQFKRLTLSAQSRFNAIINKNCARCHDKKERFALTGGINSLMQRFTPEALKSQREAMRTMAVRSFIEKMSEAPDPSKELLHNQLGMTPMQIENLRFFWIRSPVNDLPTLQKYLKQVLRKQAYLIEHIAFSDSDLEHFRAYLDTYDSGQRRFNETIEANQAYEWTTMAEKANREGIRIGAGLTAAPAILQGGAASKASPEVRQINEKYNLPDEQMTLEQEKMIYRPEEGETQDIQEHVAMVHLSKGSGPKTLILLFMGNTQLFEEKAEQVGMRKVFDNLVARNLKNTDIIVMRAGDVTSNLSSAVGYSETQGDDTNIMQAKKELLIRSFTHGQGIAKDRKYAKIRSAAYSYGVGSQYLTHLKPEIYAGIPFEKTRANDGIMLGNVLASAVEHPPALSPDHEQYYQRSDYAIKGYGLQESYTSEENAERYRSYYVTHSTGHIDIDHKSVYTLTEEMSEGLQVEQI